VAAWYAEAISDTFEHIALYVEAEIDHIAR
jgi:hypothetical protein